MIQNYLEKSSSGYIHIFETRIGKIIIAYTCVQIEFLKLNLYTIILKVLRQVLPGFLQE